MLIIFLLQAGHPFTGYYTLVLLEVILAAFLSVVYAPWMAGYTEMVEAKNPALVGTGLALWGWILRLVVGISFIFLPLVINSVNPVVDNLPVGHRHHPRHHHQRRRCSRHPSPSRWRSPRTMRPC